MAGEAAYLKRAVERYSPEVAATARAGLEKMRTLFPGARRLVFERRQLLGIGFAASDRNVPVFSLVLYPRWVRFFFFEGAALDDPEGRLEGSGSQIRSVRLDENAAILDDRYIRRLIRQSLVVADADLKRGPGEIVLKATLATRNPTSGRLRSR